jgi:hypothetical protein
MSPWIWVLLFAQFVTLVLVLFFGLRKPQTGKSEELLIEKFKVVP